MSILIVHCGSKRSHDCGGTVQHKNGIAVILVPGLAPVRARISICKHDEQFGNNVHFTHETPVFFKGVAAVSHDLVVIELVDVVRSEHLEVIHFGIDTPNADTEVVELLHHSAHFT